MSKERAKRRAERQASALQARTDAVRRDRERVEARRRRQARRAALRRLVPRAWTPAYSRRTREQRAGIIMVLISIIALTLLLFDSWTVRLAIISVALLATPVVTTAFLGRGSR